MHWGAWGPGGTRAGGPGGQWKGEAGVLGHEGSGSLAAGGSRAGGMWRPGGRGSWVAARGQVHGKGLVTGA